MLLAAAAAPAAAGALPVLDWNAAGMVDWASGYVIGYGSSRHESAVGGGPRRNDALQEARRSAADYVYRSCLGITIQEKLKVRDYLRDDPELRAELRRAVKKAAPWAVRLGSEGRVTVAVRYPLGGTGLSGLLGRIRGWYGEEGWQPAESFPAGSGQGGEITGIVFVVDAGSFTPALRPRILGSDGTTHISFERAGEAARWRPAFIPYYTSVAAGLKDPLLGEHPLIVKTEARGTDIVAPPDLDWKLATSAAGRPVVDEVRVVIVRE